MIERGDIVDLLVRDGLNPNPNSAPTPNSEFRTPNFKLPHFLRIRACSASHCSGRIARSGLNCPAPCSHPHGQHDA